MSSMIKKKGALSFKPKAPQSRRPGAPATTATTSTRPSAERLSQTPVPPFRTTLATSPPPMSSLSQSQDNEQRTDHTGGAIQSHYNNVSLIGNGPVSSTENERNVIESSTLTTMRNTIHQDKILRPPQTHASAGHGEGEIHTALNTGPQALPGGMEAIVASTVAVSGDSAATDASALTSSAAGDLSTLGAGQSLQPFQLVPVAVLNSDGTSGAATPLVSPKKAKRPTKRRRINDEEDDVRPTIEVPMSKPRRGLDGPKLPRKPRAKGTRKRKRAGTPEDAEEQEIDHTTVKMSELCKDLKIGRKFSKAAQIKQREIETRTRAKLARDHSELVPVVGNRNEGSQVIEEEAPAPQEPGPQLRLVHGQIILDDNSLIVDRHQRAAIAESVMEEVEEDEFTRVTTSGTHMKRERNIYWDNLETEKFYTGLRMFGTDFEMISKMFPNRNRRQIKLKYNKEEKAHPKKIGSALIGEKVEIDLEEYKQHTGLEYENVEDIDAEEARIEEEHNAEQQRQQEELNETDRQKKAAIQSKGTAAATAPAPGTESAKENEPEVVGPISEGGKASAASKSKKKAVTKKRRNLHSVSGGGEEVEVLGTIEDIQA